MSPLVINRQQGQAQYFTEDLGQNLGLDMVLIPGGTFEMGAPETEEGSSDDERPQHWVTVPTFFMGRYPVTQAQWKAVAKLPQRNQKLAPNPSHFKGNQRPVEQVIWYEAGEFCNRLSQKTGQSYRLPTEAEWEYACRAGTTAPFHFGETITTDLANYRGTGLEIGGETYPGSYGRGPKGIYREETTDVGSFGVANLFGLSDMHGNVWEWCQDRWHENYDGAPTDGSAWETGDDEARRVLRGGSWDNDPRLCRSTYRLRIRPAVRSYGLGFRVVCAVPRTS